MNSRVIVALIIGLIIGGILGAVGIQLFVTYQISELSTKIVELESQYEPLLNEYSLITSQYSILESEYNFLVYHYNLVSGHLSELSNDVDILNDMLNRYCKIPEAFKYVLNEEEVNKIGATVTSITEDSTEILEACDDVYKYVTNNIDYVHDIDFPYVINYHRTTINGTEYITSFTMGSTKNYIQTPQFTLEKEQGDCDDQTVLAYAMIKYFEREIQGIENTLYIADIEFLRGSSHLAIFLPVESGRLCILDLTGHFLTSQYGSITSKEAASELENYSDWWSSTEGEITHIDLYDVDVVDGNHTIAASGDLRGISEFLRTY
jgi:hypothetical protein